MMAGSITILAIVCFLCSFLHTCCGNSIFLQHCFIKEAVRPVKNVTIRGYFDSVESGRALFVLIDKVDQTIAIFQAACLYNMVPQLTDEILAVSFNQTLFATLRQSHEEIAKSSLYARMQVQLRLLHNQQ